MRCSATVLPTAHCNATCAMSMPYAATIVDDARRDDARVIVLSEYGITAVHRPIDINRALRRAGLLAIREELGREQLDIGASAAFAVADHQVAHVYVNAKERLADVKALLEALPGVERVLDETTKPRSASTTHARANWWRWLTPTVGSPTIIGSTTESAPDYARTVDIHRKPGYDPVELFLDPSILVPQLSIGWRLAKRALGCGH